MGAHETKSSPSSDQGGRCAAVDRELRGRLAKDEAIAANTLISGFPTTKVTEAKIMINPATVAGA